MKVSDILKTKGSHVYSATSNTTVLDALKQMGEKNIGALVVLDDGQLNGIISERDYARKVVLKGRSSTDTLVHEIMTEKVITVTANDSLEACMNLMSEKHIRHLAVVDGPTVVGMISISDVVTAIIRSQKETIDHLKSYISQ